MICGADEAGRGPCFGPLVVAGILVDNDSELVRIGVADSKQLTPRRREQLAPMIQKLASKYEVIIMPADDIDDLRKTMTLNELEVFVYSKIIEKLHPDVCYVDAVDVKEERFGRDILSHLSYKPRIISEHKADAKYPIVGAASILAKVTRDQQVEQIAKELEPKLNLPLGSGYPSDPMTKKFLKAWVTQFGELPPYVRRSWETCQQLIKEKNTKRLDEF
ncbi:MAG: ribonuclease HII [Candidatus Thermoplasmatota archaeon]|jgi:ribonuclease HII|nr:ribonuclease HII [Candidatus Thermoplasmatota archaeon]